MTLDANGFAVVNLCFVAVWLVLAVALVRRNKQLRLGDEMKAGRCCSVVVLSLLASPAALWAQAQPGAGWRRRSSDLTVGSRNQDPRSAFLDGETSFVVAGPWSLVGYSDFMLLMAATTWVENEAELTKLIPVEEEKARKIGRLIGKVL